jgi:hypothetical protein
MVFEVPFKETTKAEIYNRIISGDNPETSGNDFSGKFGELIELSLF